MLQTKIGIKPLHRRLRKLLVQVMGGLKSGGLKLLRGSPVSGRYRRELALKITLTVIELKAMTPAGQAPQWDNELQSSDGTAGS